jgi:hypothetical protein
MPKGHAAHSPFSSLQNAVYFIMLPFLVPVLFAFLCTGCAKILNAKYQFQEVKGPIHPKLNCAVNCINAA